MTVPAVPADGADKAPLLDVAYHHEPYWRPDQGDWIKSLLLFFDGVALLVPDYMRDRPLFTDPTLAIAAGPCARQASGTPCLADRHGREIPS